MSRTKPRIVFEDSPQETALAYLRKLEDAYYNSDSPLVSDEEYDKLLLDYESKYKTKHQNVGAPTIGEEVILPYYLGSLSKKIKEEKALGNWMKKYPGDYILMEKIDGISVLQAEIDNQQYLLTQGNGKIGTNVSLMRKYINVPFVVSRAELAIPKDVFLADFKEMKKARNVITGIVRSSIKVDNKGNINSKSFKAESAKAIHYLGYRYIDDNQLDMPQSLQLKKLKEAGISTPHYKVVKNVTDPVLFLVTLNEYLLERKTHGNYDIDGIVIYADNFHFYPDKEEDPKHIMAFKGQSEKAVTEVLSVEWNIKGSGLIKPRINIKPVILDGAEINWCSGHNARFIQDNHIGKGAVIEIIRSGEVIPKWEKTLIKGEVEFPDEDTWHWNENEVEIVANDLNTDVCKTDKIIKFFSLLEAKFVGEQTVKKIYSAGYTTLADFMDLTVEDMLKLPSVKQASAERTVNAIQKSITNVPLAKIASACGVLGDGFGERKVQSVIDGIGPGKKTALFMEMDIKELEAKLHTIGGFDTTAHKFASNTGKLVQWFKDHPQVTVQKVVKKVIDKGVMSGKIVVFSGIRDKALEARIIKQGGEVKTSVSRKTNYLVVAEMYSGSGKEQEAEKNNTDHGCKIEIVTIDWFREIIG
jgi:DNA ligase (NAD+)